MSKHTQFLIYLKAGPDLTPETSKVLAIGQERVKAARIILASSNALNHSDYEFKSWDHIFLRQS